MTEEQRKLAIAKRDVIQAYLDGKLIQSKEKHSSRWTDEKSPTFNFTDIDYRVKQEPKFRPYNSDKEFLEGSKRHGPYLIRKVENETVHPKRITKLGKVYFDFDNGSVGYTYADLLKYFFWEDNFSCGILEE